MMRQDVPIFMVNMVVVIHSGLIGKENYDIRAMP